MTKNEAIVHLTAAALQSLVSSFIQTNELTEEGRALITRDAALLGTEGIFILGNLGVKFDDEMTTADRLLAGSRSGKPSSDDLQELAKQIYPEAFRKSDDGQDETEGR